MPPTIAHDTSVLAVGLVALVIAFGLPVAAAAQWAPAPPAAADPFARRGWHVELGASAALEAWNYNISHEELGGIATGITYGVREGLVLTGSWPMFLRSSTRC